MLVCVVLCWCALHCADVRCILLVCVVLCWCALDYIKLSCVHVFDVGSVELACCDRILCWSAVFGDGVGVCLYLMCFEVS